MRRLFTVVKFDFYYRQIFWKRCHLVFAMTNCLEKNEFENNETKAFCLSFSSKMSSSSSSKGTRKTYSFEEREILISLINKHGDVEDKKSDPTSMCKRKSAWAKLAEEYNLAVGPHATRSAVQLRRCWENMKACKRNREEKRTGTTPKSLSHISNDRLRLNLANWQEGINSGQNSLDNSASASSVGLPPNIVFEPKASEPFTLQSVSASKASKMSLKNAQRDFEGKDIPPLNSCKQINILSDYTETKIELPPSIGPMGDCPDKFMTDQESSLEDNQSEREEPESAADLSHALCSNNKTNATQTFPSPQMFQNSLRNVAYRGDELHVLALSEAQMKVDIAVMQKEEARVKLEEVRYRKEEARLRMLFFTYKLDRLKED